MKLSIENHNIMLSIIHKEGLKGTKLCKVRDMVNDAVNDDMDVRSIVYWNKKVFHYKFLEQLQRDNEYMCKCKQEYDPIIPSTTAELELAMMYDKAKLYFKGVEE